MAKTWSKAARDEIDAIADQIRRDLAYHARRIADGEGSAEVTRAHALAAAMDLSLDDWIEGDGGGEDGGDATADGRGGAGMVDARSLREFASEMDARGYDYWSKAVGEAVEEIDRLRAELARAEAGRDAAVARAGAAEAERDKEMVANENFRMALEHHGLAEEFGIYDCDAGDWLCTGLVEARAEVERLKAAFAERVWGDRIALVGEEIARLKAPRAAIGREELARALYEDIEDIEDDDCPAWGDLCDGTRRAWIAMADRILAAIGGPPA